MNTITHTDFWHYPRTELTERLLNSMKYNIMHSYTIFAPRRIGKTYFLNYDLKPALEETGYKVVYFSFAEQIGDSITSFMRTIASAIDKPFIKKLVIKELHFAWCTISIDLKQNFDKLNLLELLTLLAHQAAQKDSQLVLLLDEIQDLVNIENANGFIGELRTALDLNKNNIKVIFTGSSRYGLRKMFHENKAPFFHFGTNLQMNLFDREFTDFLAGKHEEITRRKLNQDKLYQIFIKLNKITLLIREFINVCIVNPNLSIEDAYDAFEKDILFKNDYIHKWNNSPISEQAILLGIHNGISNFYSAQFTQFAKKFGFSSTQGKVQNALKKLIRHGEIYLNESGRYEFNDLFLHKWLEQHIDMKK